MATVQCSKCTAERRGFRRELDSWRHKLIHFVGFESILEGIYGQLLLRDLNLFHDCEPEQVDDWSPEASCSQCSFCNLPLDKLSDQAPAATSPLSSPSDYSPCQAPSVSESSQSAHRFLQAVFHNKDVSIGCDSNIPLVAQELMMKMIHQFALEYASKCLPNTNGVTTRTSSPLSETPDAPLDLTVSRPQEEKEKETDGESDGVLDLSNRNSACSAASSASSSNQNQKASGRQHRQKEEYIERSLELSEGLLSKALKDIRSGRLQEQRAALLYGIPLHTLRRGLHGWAEGRLGVIPQRAPPGTRDFRDEVTSYNVASSTLGGEARLVLQKVAAWAERAEIGGAAEENGELSILSSSLSFHQPSGVQKTLPHSFPQLRDALQPPPSPTYSLEPPTPLRIPQVRSTSDHHSRPISAESSGAAAEHVQTSSTEGAAAGSTANARPSSLFKLRPPLLAHASHTIANQSPQRLGARGSSLDDSEEGAGGRDKDKQPRKKRGRYRQYDHDLLEEAITMVMAGRMSVSKAQGVYGVPHSTLEYKVKERTGTLKNPPKKKSANLCSSNSNSSGSGAATSSANSGTLTSAADAKSSSRPTLTDEAGDLGQRGNNCHRSALDAVLHSLCPSHRSLLYQILKMVRQEKMLFHKSHCCHCDVNPKDYITPNAVPFNECKAHNNSPRCPLAVCDNQSHGSTMYHPGDCKSNCSVHHCPLTDCKSEGPLASGCCCLQRSRVETCTVLCPKRLHCISCQSLAVSRINNIVCTFASSPSPSGSTSVCTPSSSLCPSSSICCNLHNPHSFPCYSNHTCQTQENAADRGVGDVDPPCPVLQREQSPSPPPLSPIPADMDKKSDEKPPSLLHHGQEDGPHPIGRSDFMSQEEADMGTVAEKEWEFRKQRDSQAEQKASGTSVQDVVNRFSEILETITPIEKDPPLSSAAVCISEKEQCPSTSHDFHADAHLTEIITRVLHTGSPSDYNLSELFNHHDSKEAKSPNTRSRTRQVFAAMTSVDDASTWRQSLKIKRELAKLETSHSRRKKPATKRAKQKDENGTSSPLDNTDSNLVKEESKRELVVSVENQVLECPLDIFSAEIDKNVVKEEIQTVIVTEDVQIIKGEEKENEIFNDGKDLTLLVTQVSTPELQNKLSKQDSKGEIVEIAKPRDEPHEEVGIGSTGGSKRKHEEVLSGHGSDNDRRPDNDQDCNDLKESQNCQSHHSMESRRSRRHIVPPKRFSSYVTEPRKMFYIACFTESIFNQRVSKDKVLTSLNTLSEDPEVRDDLLESNKTPLSSPEQGGLSGTESNSLSSSKVSPQNVAGKEKISLKCSSDNGETNGSECGAKPFGRLRSSLKRQRDTFIIDAPNPSTTCAGSAPNSQVQYTSPIKIMLVLPVKDKEGIRYSLKSAGSASSGQAEEHFDPCEESSWSGTPQKLRNPSTESSTSGVKSASLPLKSATSPARNASSPTTSRSPTPKSTSSPPTSVSSSPKSASSPTKCSASPAKSISPTPRLASSPNTSSSPAKSVSSPNKSSPAKSGSSPNKSVTSPAKSGSSPNKSSASPAKSVSSPNKSPPSKSSSSPSKSGFSPNKSVTSPAKSGSSPAKSGSSPNKSSASPAKSVSSPKSASSSPRANSRRSGEGTPTKRATGTESHRFSGELPSFHETTPPKRRPGRPKKLGPQMEKKAKRPIGRPRKQQAVDEANGTKSLTKKADAPSDVEENMNKNLKITVVYGRSRRNKRTVSESFDQLQTEFHDALQAASLKSNLGMLMHNSNTSSGSIKTAVSKELNLVNPMKNCVPHSSSNIKCQKRDDSAPLRKPGRPAKVKISGISVTVNTVSPRQRKIQISKDTQKCCKALIQKKEHPESETAKEPRTISYQSTKKSIDVEKSKETKDECEDKLPSQQVAVRHSMRVKKPSIHFLHAVATSTYRSYSHSNALLRRSKQLLLNKASNERRQVEQQKNIEPSAKKGQSCEKGRKNISPDLSRVAGVSIDSIFTPKETLRWWAASAEEKTMNQELVRRIRLISDTWVSDSMESQDKEIDSKLGNKGNRKSKHSSMVRTLFDCPPNKPRSCSMQQICSWFMQTTETQSLAIVKKASSRNPYEVMHFPRSANKQMVCPSPQAERLRKHIKKFAKVVPKSPLQHQQAQKRLRKRTEAPLSPHFRRRLFTPKCAAVEPNRGSQWRQQRGKERSRAHREYQATLFRARTRFLNKKERMRRQKRQRNKKVAKRCPNGHALTGLQPKCKLFFRSAKYHLSDSLESRSASSSVNQTQEPVDVPKEQNLCSKAWSPETLKECRVFLRKINSPDNESIEEEDSCTVTLDNGSPSAYLFAGRERELVEVVKAVNTERKRGTKRAASGELAGSSPRSVQELDEQPAGRQNGKYKSPGVVSTEPPQPPPAKMLRQSRMRGLTGPRWCDFVFEN